MKPRRAFINLCASAALLATSRPAAAQEAKAAAPAAVVSSYHPIVVSGVGLIGGSKDGAWVKLEGMAKTRKGKAIDTNAPGPAVIVDMPMVQGGDTYGLYSKDRALGSGTGSKVTYQVDGAGNEYHRITIKPAAKEARAWRFAISGDWNAMPRSLKKTKKGYTLDVDGDGRDETIVLRTSQKKSAQGEGDDEVAADNKVVTFTLEMNGKKSQLIELTVDGTYTTAYEMAALDLNGDGKLDFIFTSTGHNSSLTVVDVAAGKPETVLSTYSGD